MVTFDRMMNSDRRQSSARDAIVGEKSAKGLNWSVMEGERFVVFGVHNTGGADAGNAEENITMERREISGSAFSRAENNFDVGLFEGRLLRWNWITTFSRVLVAAIDNGVSVRGRKRHGRLVVGG